MGLRLKVKVGQSVSIGDSVVTVYEIENGYAARLLIEAPSEIRIEHHRRDGHARDDAASAIPSTGSTKDTGQ